MLRQAAKSFSTPSITIPSTNQNGYFPMHAATLRLLVIPASLAFLYAAANAQQPLAPAKPRPPITYTLSAEQSDTLKRALALADFWLQVRVAAAGNTADGHGFELQRQELMGLAQVLQAQEPAAAKPAEPAPKEPPAVADPPAPAPH
jgi:hypothetical protein